MIQHIISTLNPC